MDAVHWLLAQLAATALHAGFQLTVTLVVYPALAEVPAARWRSAHVAHSRRITPVVGVVYLAALVACVGAALVAPSPAGLVALVGTLAAVAVTAARAAPAHGRLGGGRDDTLVLGLLRSDRWRCAAAVVALAGGVVAAV